MKFRFLRYFRYLIFTTLFFTNFTVVADESLGLLDRPNVTKTLLVKRLTDGDHAKLKDYTSISIFIDGKLVFCHLTDKKNLPKIICH